MDPQPPDHRETSDGAERSDPQLAELREKYLGKSGTSPMALVSAGVELAGIVAVLAFGGWWLDAKIGTEPWLMIAGAVIGTLGGLIKLIRRAKCIFERQ